MNSRKKIAWWGIATLGGIFIFASMSGLGRDIQQAVLMRLLMQAGSAQRADSVANPLLCSRPALNSVQSKTAIHAALAALPGTGHSPQLIAAALCQIGDRESALAAYPSGADADLNSALQRFAIFVQMGKSDSAIQSLLDSDLSYSEWNLAAKVIADQDIPQLDLRTILRALRQRDPTKAQVWNLWLIEGERLEKFEGWAVALAWYREGLQYPSGFEASLALRAGRILELTASPRDIPAALALMNQAITTGGFLNKVEESNAYRFRGEMYQALPKEYSTSQALAEFERALQINPNSSWAWLAKGSVYLVDFNDPVGAEGYYRQALLLDDASPYPYYYLGEAARAQGDLARARQYYQEALALQPAWQEPQDRLNSLAAGSK